MKKRPERAILRVLTVLICLLALSVSVYAEFAPNGVDRVEKPLSPAASGLPSATLRMPFTGVLDPADGKYPFYIELEGLPQGTTCWVEATLGDAADAGQLTADGGPAGLWLRFDGKKGSAQMEISIYSDSQKHTLLYQTLRFTVARADSLDYTADDAAAGVKPCTVTLTERQATFTLVFPADTITAEPRLYAQLVDSTGAICGHSEAALTASDPVLVEDARFGGIFKGENPYRIMARQAEAVVSFHRALDPGKYTLKIYNEAQDVFCSYPDLLECIRQPVVGILSWAPSVTANRPEGRTAAVQLRITGGAPDVFSISLWQGNTKLGTSENWRVERADGWRQGAVVTYEIPLTGPLEEGAHYRAEVTCDEPFSGAAEAQLPRFCADELVIGTGADWLDSQWFACFTIPSDGFVHNRQYRALLLENGRPVAAMLATPDPDGLFQLNFPAADGTPLPLQSGRCYQVTLSQWTPEGWQQCAATQPVTADKAQKTARSIRASQSVPVTWACVDLTENGVWKVTLQGEAHLLETLEGVSLCITAPDGEQTVLSPKSADFCCFDRCLTLIYHHPQDADFGWYDCSLLLEGVRLADGSGVPLLSAGSKGCYSDPDLRALGMAGTIPLYYGVENRSGELLPMTLQLYSGDNGGGTPDVQLGWTAGEEPVAGEHSIPAAFSRKRAQAVAFAHDIPALVAENAFWLPRDAALTLSGADAPACNVQTDCGENGTATLYCDGKPVEDGYLPPLSEIYVHAVPHRGYVVDTIAVNQTPMTGRAFLLAEDTQIDVTFRRSTVETFGVALEYDGTLHTVEGGTVAVSADCASVEERITLTADLQPGYTLGRLEVRLQSGGTVELTPTAEGWQFVMPGESVRVIAAIRPLYRPVITVESNNAYGTVTVPETAVEGQRVTVTATTHPASALEGLELVYQQNGEEQRLDLLASAGEGSTCSFIVPAAEHLTVRAVFAQPTVYTVTSFASAYGSVTASVPSSVATEDILLTVTAQEGYRLQAGSLLVQTGQNDILPLESRGEDFAFSMPWSDVTVWAVFEPVPSAAPGGTITTQQALFDALGGEQNAQMDADGCTVRLIRAAELQTALVFAGGSLTLDVGQYTLTAAYGLTDAALLVEHGAALQLGGTDSGGINASNANAICVNGGTLTVTGGSFSGLCGVRMTGEGSLLLRGGTFDGTAAALQLPQPVRNCLDAFVTACHPETGAEYDDFWAEQTEITHKVRFEQGQPAFDTDSVTVVGAGSALTLTIPVTHPTGDSLLLAAFYNDAGRLTGGTIQPCQRGKGMQTITVICDGAPAYGSIFLLGSTDYRPLAQSIPAVIQ